MSVQSDVWAAVAFTGLEHDVNIYTGTDASYLVLTLKVIPDEYADDEPQAERNLIMLHLYCPHTENTVTLRKQIKLALQSAGFTYPLETDASDASKQHIVFECQDVRAV